LTVSAPAKILVEIFRGSASFKNLSRMIMNFRNLIFSVVLSLGVSVFAHADTEGKLNSAEKSRAEVADSGVEDIPSPPPSGNAFSREDARLLKRLFLMSNTDLRRLREFIQRLEKMPPHRRKQMADDFERAATVKTPEQRRAFEREMRERFRRERSNLLSRYFDTLPPEQADAERKKFLSLDKKARRAYIAEVRRKLGYEPHPQPSKDGEK
jgi:hypothetical protein